MECESIWVTLPAKFPILFIKLLAYLVDFEFTNSKELDTWLRRQSMWSKPFFAVHNYGDPYAVAHKNSINSHASNHPLSKG